MGFLQETVTEEKSDYKLFQELWGLLEGEEREGVNKEDLAYILMVIRGVREPNRELDCQAEEDRQGVARYIIFDQEGNLCIRKGGQIKLAAKFRSFYINKLQAESDQKQK